MATYAVNEAGVARCRDLIDARQYVLDSEWSDVRPDADAENTYLERHSFEEYAQWHLGLKMRHGSICCSIKWQCHNGSVWVMRGLDMMRRRSLCMQVRRR